MQKLELYHFHKENNKDNIWKENNTILVPETFESTTYKRIMKFTNSFEDPIIGNITYYEYATIKMQELLLNENLDMKTVRQIIENLFDVSLKSNEFKRETVLENYRLAKKPNLPSRIHCIYLTDEKGLETWINKLENSKLTLYRVEAEGNIFKTNEQLLPEERLSYEDAYYAAYKYWNPNFKKVPDNTNEYLVQGKVKVLEKIKLK